MSPILKLVERYLAQHGIQCCWYEDQLEAHNLDRIFSYICTITQTENTLNIYTRTDRAGLSSQFDITDPNSLDQLLNQVQTLS